MGRQSPPSTSGASDLGFNNLVASVEEDFILGMDVLEKFGFKLDLRKGVVTVSKEEIILHNGKNFTATVRLLKNTTLPAHTQIVTQAIMEEDMPVGQ